MLKVHTPDPRNEHRGAAGVLAGTLLNEGTPGLEAARPRTAGFDLATSTEALSGHPAVLELRHEEHPMTVAARPPRPIPTVQANPALLREGDMIYPDISRHRNTPFRVLHHAVSARDEADRPGWRIELERDCVLWVPEGKKVRTQRRPNGQLLDPEAADRLAENYREPRYG